MSIGLLGKKVGMTQVFMEDGRFVPVTVIQAGPCKVVQKKTLESDKYNAVQVGFEEKPEKRVSKPMRGHFKKQNSNPYRFLHEFRLNDKEITEIEPGAEIKADIFEIGKHIDITGVSKGRGFTGVMKRYNFGGYPGGHGTHEVFRGGGSIGQSSNPGRVMKGQKMAGRHGNKQVTVQSLEVVDIKPEENLILVKGSVPGSNGRDVILQKAVKYLNRKEKVVQKKTGPVNPLKASKKKAGK